MRYVGPNSGKVIIPPEIDSNQVEIINTGAFSRCDKLTSVTIPAGVIRIKNHAFRGCTNLVEIIIPGTVNKIGDNTFEGCQNLTIIAPAGSYAAKYAKKHGIPFRPQPAVPEQGAPQPPQPNQYPRCHLTHSWRSFVGTSKCGITAPAGQSQSTLVRRTTRLKSQSRSKENPSPELGSVPFWAVPD